MSRGAGKLETMLFSVICESSKLVTFAAIVETLLAEQGYNGTFTMWRDDNASGVRSMRRALRTLIDKGFVAELGCGGRRQPFRYCVDPEIAESVSPETRAMMLAEAARAMQRVNVFLHAEKDDDETSQIPQAAE
jgi:hypothetical protein